MWIGRPPLTCSLLAQAGQWKEYTTGHFVSRPFANTGDLHWRQISFLSAISTVLRGPVLNRTVPDLRVLHIISA